MHPNANNILVVAQIVTNGIIVDSNGDVWMLNYQDAFWVANPKNKTPMNYVSKVNNILIVSRVVSSYFSCMSS